MKAKHILYVLATIAFLSVTFFLLAIFGFLINLDSKYVSVDINSGRIRTTTYRFFIKSENIVDSELTKALEPSDYENKPNDWHMVSDYALFSNALVCYRFGGATMDIHGLSQIWKRDKYSKSARRESALKVLAIWQREGSALAAFEYLNELDIHLSDKLQEDLPK